MHIPEVVFGCKFVVYDRVGLGYTSYIRHMGFRSDLEYLNTFYVLTSF